MLCVFTELKIVEFCWLHYTGNGFIFLPVLVMVWGVSAKRESQGFCVEVFGDKKLR